MTAADLEIARYLAELANVPNIHALTKTEQRRLAGVMVKIPGARAAVLAHHREKGEQDRDIALRYLGALHTHVREILPRLLAGKSVLVQPPARPYTQTWRLVNGALSEELPPSDHALAYFAQLCRQKRFPFALCPTCEAIFARMKRQRYGDVPLRVERL